jgi:TPR repeat protein
MSWKAISALIVVGIAIATVAAAFGYFRLQTDEQQIVAATISDTSPIIVLNVLDGPYLSETRLLADHSSAVAQTVLGARYQYGLGVPGNPVLMIQNYRAAATKGNPTAELMLGRLYDPYLYANFITINNATMAEEIHGVSGEILLTKNDLDAKNWYSKSAAQGNVAAEVMLGNLFEKEERMDDNNIVIAAGWYQKAAEQGDVVGELKIGNMYVGGYGVSKDEDKGIEWLKKAAAQGNVEAELSLGVEYESGHAMIRDNQKAAKWYLLAAQHGDYFAQRDIGMFYAKGIGVPRDYVKAYVWLNKAAAHDAPSAAETRNSLELLMTPSQLEEAQGKDSSKNN